MISLGVVKSLYISMVTLANIRPVEVLLVLSFFTQKLLLNNMHYYSGKCFLMKEIKINEKRY